MPTINIFPQLNGPAVMIMVTAVVVAAIINFIPFLWYPFQLFVVMIHELGHVFAARLTRGEVSYFKVFSNATGVTFSNGDRLWIVPAGYLGTALFSAGLILLTGLPAWAPTILITIGSFLILLIVLYAQLTIADNQNTEKDGDQEETRKSVTKIVGLFFGVNFIAVGWLMPPILSVFLLDLLAIQSTILTFYLLNDLVAQVRLNQKKIDPANMTDLKGRKPILLKSRKPMFWTSLWYLYSILLVGTALWFTWLRSFFI